MSRWYEQQNLTRLHRSTMFDPTLTVRFDGNRLGEHGAQPLVKSSMTSHLHRFPFDFVRILNFRGPSLLLALPITEG
jgi:hypothetical protein